MENWHIDWQRGLPYMANLVSPGWYLSSYYELIALRIAPEIDGCLWVYTIKLWWAILGSNSKAICVIFLRRMGDKSYKSKIQAYNIKDNCNVQISPGSYPWMSSSVIYVCPWWICHQSKNLSRLPTPIIWASIYNHIFMSNELCVFLICTKLCFFNLYKICTKIKKYIMNDDI